jgi:hypothetical protein
LWVVCQLDILSRTPKVGTISGLHGVYSGGCQLLPLDSPQFAEGICYLASEGMLVHPHPTVSCKTHIKFFKSKS